MGTLFLRRKAYETTYMVRQFLCVRGISRGGDDRDGSGADDRGPHPCQRRLRSPRTDWLPRRSTGPARHRRLSAHRISALHRKGAAQGRPHRRHQTTPARPGKPRPPDRGLRPDQDRCGRAHLRAQLPRPRVPQSRDRQTEETRTPALGGTRTGQRQRPGPRHRGRRRRRERQYLVHRDHWRRHLENQRRGPVLGEQDTQLHLAGHVLSGPVLVESGRLLRRDRHGLRPRGGTHRRRHLEIDRPRRNLVPIGKHRQRRIASSDQPHRGGSERREPGARLQQRQLQSPWPQGR